MRPDRIGEFDLRNKARGSPHNPGCALNNRAKIDWALRGVLNGMIRGGSRALGRKPLYNGIADQFSCGMNIQISHQAVLMELDGFHG